MPAPQTEVLITVAGAERGRYVFAPGEYVLGCDADCHIPIEAELVSQRHAKLTLNFDTALIEDLGGGNGTQVNGKPVAGRTRLWPNQKIQIGAATVELRRLKTGPDPDRTLAPTQEVVKRVLPDAFLREKKYDIGGVVAQGGMGAILDAREATTERTIAMKVMLDSNDPDALLRFLNEAKVTAQLEHPNIVPVHELSVDENGQPFYTMKFVKGTTLRKVLEKMAAERSQESAVRGQTAEVQSSLTPDSCPLTPSYPLPVLLTAFQKVCDAIAFAHSKGVIHRDLKPENIMLGDFGEVLVMDWGLAKRLRNTERREGKDGSAPAEEDIHTIRHSVAEEMPASAVFDPATLASTMAGTVMGTPQYMAPEQARGEIETLDARADIYALGAILFHLLFLRPSVNGKDSWEIIGKVARGEIEPLECSDSSPLSDGGGAGGGERAPRGAKAPMNRRTPQSLAAVVRKAMALEREQRYARVADLQADITAYQNGFATAAEQASLMKQLLLLIQRHKGVFVTAAAAWFIITALAAWFVIHLRASERETRRQADIAMANEKRAVTNEQRAVINEQRAEANEQKALAEKEATRRALAKARIAVADAAYRNNNAPEMRAALQEVPEDLRDPDWSYLIAKSDASIATVRPGVELTGVAAHPKEPGVFAVAGNDGKVTVLRARTGEKLLEFEAVFSPQNNPKNKGLKGLKLAFSPDGQRIAIGHGGKGILIHNARDGTKLAEWDSRGTADLQFSPDGRLLLQETRENSTYRSVALWDAASGTELWSIWNPEAKNLQSAVFTPDGKRIVCVRFGTVEPFVTLSVKDGALLQELKPQSKMTFPLTIALAPGGGTIIAGGSDGDVLGMSLNDGSVLFRSWVHDRGISQVAFTPDGNRFVAVAVQGDGRQSIQVWNAKNGKRLQALLGGNAPLNAISVHPLSGEMLLGGKDSRLWNLATSPEIWTSDKSGSAAQFWGSDDTLFAARSSDHAADLWDLRDGRRIWEPAPRKEHSLVNISADGRYAAIPGSPLLILRQTDGKPEVVNAGMSCFFQSIVRLSPDGSRIVIREKFGGGKCFVRESMTGKKPRQLSAEGVVGFNDICWVTGGTRIVGLVTMNDKRRAPASEERIILWDAATGQQLHSIVQPSAMDVLAVSPDGLSFAEAGADRLVRIRDAATLAVKQQFRVHDEPITTLAWHPTKPILATGSADLSVKIWNLETGRSLEEFRGLVNIPNSMSFSPGGTRLACSVNQEGTRVWEPLSLQPTP